MSKTQVKKELATFSSDELLEVVLNLYDASKDAKAYLEFFINPDVASLMDKKVDIMAKEIARAKWGRSRGRISVIKDAIRSFQSFGVPATDVIDLYIAALRMLVGQYRYLTYTSALYNGTIKLGAALVQYANKNELLSYAIEKIDTIVRSDLGTQGIRKELDLAVREQIAKIK